MGFTTINRFAALRAMEVRDFLSKETLCAGPSTAGASHENVDLIHRVAVRRRKEAAGL